MGVLPSSVVLQNPPMTPETASLTPLPGLHTVPADGGHSPSLTSAGTNDKSQVGLCWEGKLCCQVPCPPGNCQLSESGQIERGPGHQGPSHPPPPHGEPHIKAKVSTLQGMQLPRPPASWRAGTSDTNQCGRSALTAGDRTARALLGLTGQAARGHLGGAG